MNIRRKQGNLKFSMFLIPSSGKDSCFVQSVNLTGSRQKSTHNCPAMYFVFVCVICLCIKCCWQQIDFRSTNQLSWAAEMFQDKTADPTHPPRDDDNDDDNDDADDGKDDNDNVDDDNDDDNDNDNDDADDGDY